MFNIKKLMLSFLKELYKRKRIKSLLYFHIDRLINYLKLFRILEI